MNSLFRYLAVGLAFAVTGFFAQAAVESAAPGSQPGTLAKVVKKTAKKHKKHKKKKVE